MNWHTHTHTHIHRFVLCLYLNQLDVIFNWQVSDSWCVFLDVNHWCVYFTWHKHFLSFSWLKCYKQVLQRHLLDIPIWIYINKSRHTYNKYAICDLQECFQWQNLPNAYWRHDRSRQNQYYERWREETTETQISTQIDILLISHQQ